MHGRGRENFVHDDDGMRCCPLQDRVDAPQIVLELATQIFDFLFAFKMGEELVEEKEPRLSARHRAAEAAEVMQLSEAAREGRLAALIRAADDDDPLPAL